MSPPPSAPPASAVRRSAPPALRILADRPAEVRRGILIILLGFFVITLGDVAAKAALPAGGVALVMIGRGVFGAAAMALFAVLRAGDVGRGLDRLRPRRLGLVAFRSLLQGLTSMAWYVSWLSMDLASTYALGFTSPLLITVLAVPMLGEKLRWRRVLSTLAGFLGVLVMLRPGGGLWHPVVLLLMGGIVGMAFTRIMTRMLSTTETPECIAFALLVAQIATGLALLPLFPLHGVPDARLWALLLALGVLNALANWLFAHALALAPVSALAPYEYTLLVWGGLFGYLVFGDVPTGSTIAGAAVVVLAGLYNFHRERLRKATAA